MILATIAGLLTGIAFGIVLYKVGATRYSRVMGMLTLRDTKIMKFAFTTVSVASILYGLASLAGVSEAWSLETRIMPYLGGAHLLGGVLFGAAMGFTGLCPGTCAAKAGGRAGEKRFGGIAALVGLVIGVLIFSVLRQPLADAGVYAARPRSLTLHGFLGLPYGVVAVCLGAMVLGIVLLVDRFTPEMKYEAATPKESPVDWIRGEWSFFAGGTLAALLIVGSTMQGEYLGFSGALLALVGTVAHAIGMPLAAVPKIDHGILWHAALIAGALIGGFGSTLFSTYTTRFEGVGKRKPEIDAKHLVYTASMTGMMALGALIGGGCTTGAFLSAWPTLSIGSFAMGLTFFATAMGVSQVRIMVRNLDIKASQKVGEKVWD